MRFLLLLLGVLSLPNLAFAEVYCIFNRLGQKVECIRDAFSCVAKARKWKGACKVQKELHELRYCRVENGYIKGCAELMRDCKRHAKKDGGHCITINSGRFYDYDRPMVID